MLGSRNRSGIDFLEKEAQKCRKHRDTLRLGICVAIWKILGRPPPSYVIIGWPLNSLRYIDNA